MTAKAIIVFTVAANLSLLWSSCTTHQKQETEILKLSKWDRGIKVTAGIDSSRFAYFWFYEWHLFDAIEKGEHTSGKSDWRWEVAPGSQSAIMDTEWMMLKMDAEEDGVDLLLEITNTTDYIWPDIAAMIPCFNPGSDRGNTDAVENPIFSDDSHENTWFLSQNGLDLISGEKFPREIHFNHQFLLSIMDWEKESEDGEFVFSFKWPTSARSAYDGLMIRESEDHEWVMGIAWDAFLSVQGHNPWKCMHLSVQVGPLNKGEAKKIKGKIYLFEGSKEDCLKKYKQDFGAK